MGATEPLRLDLGISSEDLLTSYRLINFPKDHNNKMFYEVRFKDGTISCKPLSDELFQKPIGQALYHNTTSMKCPLDTKIDGGTFNSDVLVCATTTSKGTSPQNSNGDALCKYAIPVKSVSASGVATELIDDWMDYAVSIGAKTNDLDYYGISSMTPKDVTDEEGNPLKEVYKY